MNVSDFDFDLPPELIAQVPAEPRGSARLMVLDRRMGRTEEARVGDLHRWLKDGDVLVLNDTRVFPARLLGHRVPSGGAVECLLLGRLDADPSETPAKFEPVTDSFDHVKRDVMIPMRDGVKLHTVILVPKGAKGAPILLTRTPYDATALTSHAHSAHLGPVLQGYDHATDVIVEGGYIRAVQDVRGKYGSEGDYVMNRPQRGPRNPTNADHATDTYDTIEVAGP